MKWSNKNTQEMVDQIDWVDILVDSPEDYYGMIGFMTEVMQQRYPEYLTADLDWYQIVSAFLWGNWPLES